MHHLPRTVVLRPNGRVLQGTLFAAAAVVLLAPRLVRADELGRYNFGLTVPTATLAPTAVGANLSASSITADAGLVLDLSSPVMQPAR